MSNQRRSVASIVDGGSRVLPRDACRGARPASRPGGEEKARRRDAYVTTMHSPDGSNQSIRVDRSRPFVLRPNSGQGAMERGRTDGWTDGRRAPGQGSRWPAVGLGQACRLTPSVGSVNVNATLTGPSSQYTSISHQSWPRLAAPCTRTYPPLLSGVRWRFNFDLAPAKRLDLVCATASQRTALKHFRQKSVTERLSDVLFQCSSKALTLAPSVFWGQAPAVTSVENLIC